MRVNWTISIAIAINLALQSTNIQRREFTFNFSFQNIVLLSFMMLMSMTMKWMLSSSLFTFSYPPCLGQNIVIYDDYVDDNVIIHIHNNSITLYVRWKRFVVHIKEAFFLFLLMRNEPLTFITFKKLHFNRISFTFPYSSFFHDFCSTLFSLKYYFLQK